MLYMVKIWGKVIKNERIIKSYVLEIDETQTSFFDMLKTMCEKLNIPTPVLLDKHVYDFNLFKMCTFKPDDFIEEVHFDKFILELMRSN